MAGLRASVTRVAKGRHWRAVLATTVLLGCPFASPPSAIADTSRDGWGLSITDDEANWNNLTASVNLDERFVRLRPKMYRLQILWNAKEPAPSNPTQAQLDAATNRAGWITRTHALIDRARSRGVEKILLTLRANESSTVGTGGYTPTATRYKLEIDKVVQEFANKVDIWGGINEPNYWKTGANSTGAIPVATLVNYQANLAEVVATRDPDATWTSPDFNDETGAWSTYVSNYKAAGGGWGHVAAFHPYKAATDQSLATINTYASIIPSSKDIWVTEVGAHFSGNPSAQATRVAWIAKAQPQCPTSAACSLASHDRVKRISYYHMRNHSSQWDSALLNSDLTRRQAWYIWCASSHGDNPSHIDCDASLGSDIGITGDWNGDGSDTIGVFRPSNAMWYLRDANSEGLPHHYINYGISSNLPVAGDWNGSGNDTIGVFDQASAMWYLRNSNTNGAPDYFVNFGLAGDIPVVGDWNNDGIDTIGVFRPSTAMWYLRDSNSNGPPDHYVNFGISTNLPVVGDWNGDGSDTIGVYDQGTGMWYMRNSNSNGAPDLIHNFGYIGNTPVSGDWNSNGTPTIGVFKPSSAGWALSDSNFSMDYSFSFGLPG